MMPAHCWHLQIIREFEGHLRTVVAERDAALGQLEFVEGRRAEADRRLREAERKEVGAGQPAGRLPLRCTAL